MRNRGLLACFYFVDGKTYFCLLVWLLSLVVLSLHVSLESLISNSIVVTCASNSC